MPGGLDQKVGETGWQLSQGEEIPGCVRKLPPSAAVPALRRGGRGAKRPGRRIQVLRRFDEGLALYREALRSTVAEHGEESQVADAIYHNIGGILHARGDFTAAEEPGRKAWEISRRLLGADHPRTLADASAYAGILDGLARYKKSEPTYRRALTVFEEVYGHSHHEVAGTLHNLGRWPRAAVPLQGAAVGRGRRAPAARAAAGRRPRCLAARAGRAFPRRGSSGKLR